MAFRRGFKSEAERLALSVRQELGLGTYARLDPFQLAEHLAIPVLSLTDLARRSPDADLAEAVSVLCGPESSSVSAYTVIRGSRRMVVYNDAQTLERGANSIAHELSHGLHFHLPSPALDDRGCRHWNQDMEDEASFQGGALLIPSKAAWAIAKRRQPLAEAALKYGVSVEVVRWRINASGANRLLAG